MPGEAGRGKGVRRAEAADQGPGLGPQLIHRPVLTALPMAGAGPKCSTVHVPVFVATEPLILIL